ncbi:MAG TPA: dTDP-glucose 4,6-dehydratase [Bdellovibrionota bacterium]|nr:dTDP-glucose 4,6-dehydratase [Bdellovibrionota bacterium]
MTGGLGFIGSNYVRYLIDHDLAEEITVLDKLTYAGCCNNFEPRHRARIDLVRGDICNAKAVLAALIPNRKGMFPVEAIVHFAAESHVDRSILDGSPFVQTNVLGTHTLLVCATTYFTELKDSERERFRFINVSTDEVYGTLGPAGYFSESSPLLPNSPYSAAKAGADSLARAYYQTHKLPVVTTRCSNNYGPFQFPEKFIPVVILNALSDRPIPVYAKGENVRDWIHVSDHCAGIQRTLESGKIGEVYNFGGESERRNIDLAKEILAVLKKPESLIRFVEDRKGHDFRYAIKLGKARELGWRPQITLEEGLRKTVEWYRDNRKWWTAIQGGKYQELTDWKVREAT